MMTLALLLSAAALAAPDNPGFETPGDDGVPAGWSRGLGAQTGGGGRMATVEIVPDAHTGEAAVRFEGDARVQRWPMLQTGHFPVTPGRTLRFGGWVRAEDVRKERNQYANCNVGLTLHTAEGGRVSISGTRPVEGTVPWTAVEQRVRVPGNAATGRLFVFCSVSGTAWFDDVFVEAVESGGVVVEETPWFVFHAPDDAPISAEHKARNEATLARLSQALGVMVPGRIQYHRYRDNAHKGELTGFAGNAHATPPLEVHTIWPVDDHEVVHLLTAVWGETDSAVLGEGIAVAMGGRWQGRPVHEWIPELRADGRLPALADILDPAAFREVDDIVTYAVSGSFVKWLVDTYGMDRFRQAYVGTGGTAARLKAVYGVDLRSLESAWLAEVGLD